MQINTTASNGFIGIHAEDMNLEDYPYDSKTTGLRSWRRMLVMDQETGVSVSLQHHVAGDMGKPHTHTCAHGMYVVSGTLCTNFGNYGAGSFVWFDSGVVMQHGAGPDEDVTYLFITNKQFDITYLEEPEDRR